MLKDNQNSLNQTQASWQNKSYFKHHKKGYEIRLKSLDDKIFRASHIKYIKKNPQLTIKKTDQNDNSILQIAKKIILANTKNYELSQSVGAISNQFYDQDEVQSLIKRQQIILIKANKRIKSQHKVRTITSSNELSTQISQTQENYKPINKDRRKILGQNIEETPKKCLQKKNICFHHFKKYRKIIPIIKNLN